MNHCKFGFCKKQNCKKRLSQESKINAYNEAIDYLLTEECSYDTDEDRAARRRLAKKLSNECKKIKTAKIIKN